MATVYDDVATYMAVGSAKKFVYIMKRLPDTYTLELDRKFDRHNKTF